MFLPLILLLGFRAVHLEALPINSTFQGMMFLNRYGYISDGDMSTISSTDDENFNLIMKEALNNFQDRMGINVTGVMDAETMAVMNMPRCGVKDINPLQSEQLGHSRRRRYLYLGRKWDSSALTYRINSYPRRIGARRTEGEIATALVPEIERAFQTWSSVCPLNFRRETSFRPGVDIDIEFSEIEHGDGNSFDGPGKTLAHAFPPQGGLGGDAHFDIAENWLINSTDGIDIFSVALHEFGHSLGLAHSNVKGAVMFPTYSRYRNGFTLQKDDIDGIRSIYRSLSGRRKPPPSVSKAPADTSAPSLCRIQRIDAAANTLQGIYIFFRTSCYLLGRDLAGVVEGYPKKIADEWPGIGDVDELSAALSWPDGQNFLFKGNRVWAFWNRTMQEGYPRDIKDVFPGIPSDLNAAIWWAQDQKTYFIKADQYFRFDQDSSPPVKRFYPVPIHRWRGLTGVIDAALQLNRSVIFFKDTTFYLYSDQHRLVLPGFPKITNDHLFGCKPDSSFQMEDEEVKVLPEARCGSSPDPESDEGTGIQSRRGKPKNDKGNSGTTLKTGISHFLLVLVTIMICAWDKRFH